MLLERLGLGTRPAIALMPGAAYGPAKQWPIGSFTALAGYLTGGASRSGFSGRPASSHWGSRSARSGRPVFNLCGQTSLEDTVDLLSATRAAVTNDSGLMHVAAAAGTMWSPSMAAARRSSRHRSPPKMIV